MTHQWENNAVYSSIFTTYFFVVSNLSSSYCVFSSRNNLRLPPTAVVRRDILKKASLGRFMLYNEGVIEEFSHRDHGTSRIVSAFVVCDCDDEAKAQRKKHLRSCVDAASGVRSPEAAVLD